jgi:hypothetical protein
MKMSDEIQIGLRRLFNSKLINDDHFKAVVDSVTTTHILLDQEPEGILFNLWKENMHIVI